MGPGISQLGTGRCSGFCRVLGGEPVTVKRRRSLLTGGAAGFTTISRMDRRRSSHHVESTLDPRFHPPFWPAKFYRGPVFVASIPRAFNSPLRPTALACLRQCSAIPSAGVGFGLHFRAFRFCFDHWANYPAGSGRLDGISLCRAETKLLGSGRFSRGCSGQTSCSVPVLDRVIVLGPVCASLARGFSRRIDRLGRRNAADSIQLRYLFPVRGAVQRRRRSQAVGLAGADDQKCFQYFFSS